MSKIFFVLIISGLVLVSCLKEPNYPNEPIIKFERIEFTNTNGLNAIKQNVDTVFITFSFTDGDGDLGAATPDPTSNFKNIILTDTRSGFEEFYQMPFIPKQGVANAISGEVTLTVKANCCIPTTGQACQPNPGQNPEDIVYTIQVFDQQENYSNIVNIAPITHICD